MPAAQTAMEKKKRSFAMPHVFVILTIIMLLVWIISFFVPSGNFERVLDPNSGREIVNPDVFNLVEKEYIMPDTFFQTFYNGIVGGISIMANLLICSGVLGFLESTGAFSAGIHKLVRATKGKELSLVVIMYLVFTIFGVLGYGEGAYPFYGLAVMVIMSAGFDRMTGAATVILGSCGSFACGMLNMFTTGVSQQIVGLPMFSGMWYRAIVLVVFFTIGLVFLLHYAIKIRKDPTKSYCYEEYKDQDAGASLGEEVPMDWRRVIALLGFLVVTIIQGYGCVVLSWSFPNITAMYIIFMILLALLFRISPNEVCNRFTAGAARVLGPALAIGFANGVMVLLNEANIMDTVVYYMSNALQGKSPLITLLIIYVFVTCLNFFVVSGSGKAVMMMPILSPLG
ncbi:MAG TPA: YfcC family protein, partial [Candidatus Lawsonibacter pullicola]|nr:YfcC family protein [Candidatus Lawsonibacter pullicola]